MDHISGSNARQARSRSYIGPRYDCGGRSMAKLKASAPVVPIDGGPPCPRCGRLMQRYMQRYGGDKEAARHRYWNHCRPCKEDPWLAQRARTLGVRALGYKDFEAYLAGPHWQSFRERALEEQRTWLQRNICECCGMEGVAFDVHHKTYERLGNELIEDCQVLCEQCHDKLHGRDPKSQSRHYANR